MESMTWEEITPEKAKEYLKCNKGNRTISWGTVHKYVNDMKSGNWDEFTPDNLISFNENGVLINGQHRLLAVSRAGVKIKMRVLRNVDVRAFVIDGGKKRTTADNLTMTGEFGKVDNSCVAVAKLLYLLYTGETASAGDTKKVFARYQDLIRQSVVVARRGTKNPVGNKAACMTAAFLAMKDGMSQDDLLGFWETVNTGIPACETPTPALVLRNHLLDIKMHGGSGGGSRQIFLFNVATQAIFDFSHNVNRKMRYDSSKRKYNDIILAIAKEMEE